MSSYLNNPCLCSLGKGTAYEVLDPWVRWDKRPGTARIVALRRRVIESSSYYVLPIVNKNKIITCKCCFGAAG